MDTSILFLSFDGKKITFKSKVFLNTLLKKYGKSIANKTIDEISKNLDVTSTTVFTNLAQLKSARYIRRSASDNIFGKKRGAKYTYTFTSKLFKELDSISQSFSNHHSDQIDYVGGVAFMEAINSKAEDLGVGFVKLNSDVNNKKSQLDLLPFVLSLLLRLSNEKGIVKGYGLSILAKYLGVGKSKFKFQIERLKQLGIIRRVVSGISSKTIFGKKPSIYYLNLNSTHFKGELSKVQLYVMDMGDYVTDAEKIRSYVKALINTMREKSKWILPNKQSLDKLNAVIRCELSMDEFKEVAKTFTFPTQSWLNYFQETINIFASDILQIYLKEGSIDSELDGFELECKEAVAQWVEPKLCSQNNVTNIFVNIIYGTSLALAEQVYSMIKKCDAPYDFDLINIHKKKSYSDMAVQGKGYLRNNAVHFYLEVFNGDSLSDNQVFMVNKLTGVAGKPATLSVEQQKAYGIRVDGNLQIVDWGNIFQE